MVSVAQLDRALGCGPSGRGFESFHSFQASVAQLDRASDFESAGRPFEPDRARHLLKSIVDKVNCEPLAQLVEQLTLNQ
jgi:hypothetical protein